MLIVLNKLVVLLKSLIERDKRPVCQLSNGSVLRGGNALKSFMFSKNRLDF